MPGYIDRRLQRGQERVAASDGPAKPIGRAALIFFSRLAPQGECLVWNGPLTKDGYGQLSADGRLLRAHRFAYELVYGAIPAGLHVDHLCCNRACVNPDHLEAVSPRVNWERGKGGSTGLNAKKTHCKRGHEFTSENTYVQPSRPRSRACRICMREASKRWAHRNPEKFKRSQKEARSKWGAKNRRRLSAYNRAWLEANPEKREEYERRRKAKRDEYNARRRAKRAAERAAAPMP